MNTVEKGDEFEDRAFDLINRLLNNQELGILPGQCRVFKKKSYYSRDRESNIIFDLAIEVTPPKAERPVMIWLIECKNYKSPIPVNRIEEFSDKIRQVTGHNCKGVFIATNKIQGGGHKICKNRGLMLIHVNSSMIHDIVMHRVGSKKIKEELNEKQIDFISDYEDPFIKKLLEEHLNSEIEKKLLIALTKLNPIYESDHADSIPILSSIEIQDIAESLLSRYNPKTTEDGVKLLIKPFVDYIEDLFDLEVVHETIEERDEQGNQVLGKCEFLKRKITIDKSLLNTDRYLFSLAHELGHYILHSKVKISQKTYESLSHSQRNFLNEDEKKLKSAREWIEWQANKFASNIAVPRAALALKLNFYLGQMGRNLNRRFYLDSQPRNIKEFSILVTQLAMYFGVSKSVIEYRLDDFNFVDKASGSTHPTHIRRIIK